MNVAKTLWLIKGFSILCLLCVSCISNNERLSIEENINGINISCEGKERLSGLKTKKVSNTNQLNSTVLAKKIDDFVVITLHSNFNQDKYSEDFFGAFFDSIPNFKQGITLWRYKPWNAWSKPILIKNPKEIEDWDIQFFYWEYEDGLFGSAMPLSGNGYRTTLGSHIGKFGAKSTSLVSKKAFNDTIPQMLLGFGKEPYKLFENLFKKGLEVMGKSENSIDKKIFPNKMDYIGWCTWNASDNGKNLTEDFVVESVKTFTENDFPLGWVMIDDGWIDHKDRKINSFTPDKEKFPNGFKPLNQRLKEECNIKEIGVWQTFNGYWNGINIDSELGKKYSKDLFEYYPKKPKSAKDSLNKQYFVKPDSDELLGFYREMHQTFSDQGFTFLKVDNQLVTEKMAVDNYPIFTLSEKMHESLYKSADEYFDGAVINCMDMTAEAYLNFGNSAVARAVEDYFPAEEDKNSGVGYKLPYGNAAVHVLMGLYNSLYFQHMVFPDLDMFESHNPYAEFHAVARAINNGPVYLTDRPGFQNFNILHKLCYSDGHLIRPSSALIPTKDCLFQMQDNKPFKAFSKNGNVGLLGVWNMADINMVSGSIAASDIDDINGEVFIVYEHFSKKFWRVKKDEKIPVDLSKMETKLFYVFSRH